MARVKRSRFAFLSGYRRTARLYLKSKIGMIGLVIILFFVILAIFSPELTSNNPVFDVGVGAPYSVPAWATIFPQYSGYAVTGYVIRPVLFASTSDLDVWTLSGVTNGTVTRGISTAAPHFKSGPVYPGSMQVNASIIPVNQSVRSPSLPYGQAFFSLSQSFQWTTKAPNEFLIAALIKPLKVENVSAIYLNFIVSTPTSNLSLSSNQTFILGQEIRILPNQFGQWKWSNISDALLPLSGLPAFVKGSPSSIVFNQVGKYTLTLQVMGIPNGDNPSISMNIASLSFHEQGNAYGLLGTDNEGRDVWSQLVWGSQISLMIGILSGVGAVAMGALAGLAAGYLGGLSDEIISRVTDFFLVLPFLPLLIILVLIISQNDALYANLYWWIIAVFVILSWPSIAKIIRSQVLSVKERQYVEASRALGGGTPHIIRKHILPNVMGLVYSQVALNVSGFILLEAALDYLAVSLHPIDVITWGAMLTNALPDATANSSAGYVWWWFLPPGIAIAALSLAFVLVGFALDSIFNPRLRAR
jgi:peptide/nickel transport system permease protein